jgi:multiple sugar transport system substrate-binding protein
MGGASNYCNVYPEQGTCNQSKLIHDYKISPPNTFTTMKEEDVRIAFQNGNALFERNWPYAWPLHQNDSSAVKGNVGITALPYFPGGKSVSTMGGWHAGISTFSDNKEQAWKFIQYITSYEVQKALSIQLGWNPGREDVYEDEEVLAKMPHFAKLKDVLTNTVPRPAVPYYTQISIVLQKHINAVLARKTDVADGLEQAETEINQIINRYEK